MLRRFAIALFLYFGMYSGLYAQLKILPKEKIDNIANPRLSADSSAIRFEAEHIVAETMNEDDAPKDFVFRFTNVGDDVIHIDRLVSTCSCASASSDKTEVLPGEQAAITVRYTPKGHPGSFERRVFLYTGKGSAPAAVLKLSVNVENGSDLSGLWPVQMGTIRLRRSELVFKEGQKAVESLRFINLSGRPLRLECEDAFLPGFLSFKTIPEVLEDGMQGEILISYAPSEPLKQNVVKVILKGLGVPPSRSSLIVRIEQ